MCEEDTSATRFERMRLITDEAWQAAKAAGATWLAGRLIVPLPAEMRWGTDAEWRLGVLRVWRVLLPCGKVLLAEDTQGTRSGWIVSLA